MANIIAAINIGINPYAFLNVRWYGIMVALGVALVVGWAIWQAGKGKFTSDDVLTAAIVGIPCGVIFSKIFNVIDYIVVAKTHPELVLTGSVIDYTQHWNLIFSGAGLSIDGAVLGAALGIFIYSRFNKRFRFGIFVDAIAPAIILAQAIGRVGCTINGCSPGTPTNLPWAFVYTNVNSMAPLGVPTQPTVVYEIIYDLIVFGILMSLRDKLKPVGSLFAVYLSLYAVWRLGSDFIRIGNPFLFGLHEVQVIAIIILLITIPFIVLNTRWVKKDIVAEERSVS